jgi:hypothetical protein
MPDDPAHDWHLFDVERGYDAKPDGSGRWLLRDRDGSVTELTAEEFEQSRVQGPNPKGLE